MLVIKSLRNYGEGRFRYESHSWWLSHSECRNPNIIGIQVGAKDHDEVIPAEMCIITPNQWYTQKLPPEFLLLMVKFSSKNLQDCLVLISTGINNHITADQRSVSDMFIFSWVWLTAYTGPGLSGFTLLARCWLESLYPLTPSHSPGSFYRHLEFIMVYPLTPSQSPGSFSWHLEFIRCIPWPHLNHNHRARSPDT